MSDHLFIGRFAPRWFPWTPCIGPALATVQTLAFTEASAFRGALLSLGYCFGLGMPFIATGLFLDKSEKLRKFLTRNGRVISIIGGALLILIGILQVSGVWNSLMIDLRSAISEFAPGKTSQTGCADFRYFYLVICSH